MTIKNLQLSSLSAEGVSNDAALFSKVLTGNVGTGADGGGPSSLRFAEKSGLEENSA